MPHHPDSLAGDFVDSALELHRRRLWQAIESDAVFLIRVPTEPLPVVANVLGHAGRDPGLGLARGERAFHHVAGMYLDWPKVEEFSEAGDLMTLSFLPPKSLPRQFRGRLRKIGIDPRRGRIAAVPLVKRPFELAFPPGPGDLKTMLWIVLAVLAAHDAGELRPPALPGPSKAAIPAHRRRILELDVGGTLHEPIVNTRIVPWPTDTEALELPPLVALPPDLAQLPRVDERWLVVRLYMATEVRGDPRAITSLFFADERTGLIVGQAMAMGDELAPLVDGLAETIRGQGVEERPGLPRELVFDSPRLHAAFAPALAGLDVRAGLDPTYPPLRALSAEIERTAAALAPR